MGVFKRKDGKSPFYQYEFVLRTGRGEERRRFRGSTGETSEREALAFERDEKARRRDELKAELDREPKTDTVDSVFERYWDAYGYKLSWAYTVERHMRDMLAFFGGATPFADIGNAEVAKMLEHYAKQTTRLGRAGSQRESAPVSDSTINRRIAVLKRIHRLARDLWELKTKPINWRLHRRKEAKERVRHITREQAQVLVTKLPQNVRLMAGWSFATGCRLNETENLTWDRVNYETCQAEVETKGGGTRFVNLGAAALKVLSNCDRGGHYVFDATNRKRAWAAALKAARLKDFRWHDMRHCFATWVGNDGADIAVIQKLLGHSDIRVTKKCRRVITAEAQRAVQNVPALIEGNIEPLVKGKKA